MEKQLVPALAVIVIVTASFTCPTSPARLQFANETEPAIWRGLEDANCDTSSEEAQEYVDCRFDVIEENNPTSDCDDALAKVPGCDLSILSQSPQQLSISALDELVPLTYRCARPASLGSWYTHLDTDVGYQDYYDLVVTVAAADTFNVGFEASFERQYDADPPSYTREERTGNGTGIAYNDGFLEGTASASGFLRDWWIHDTRREEETRRIGINESYWVVGFLHPDLLTMEVCIGIQGAFQYDKDAILEGGWQSLISGSCPSLAFPGHLTCTLFP